MAQQANLLLPTDPEANFDVINSGIQNTGAASCDYNNYTLNVMVWDGPEQGFGWEYPDPSRIDPTTGNHDFYIDADVHDPDVIIVSGDLTLMYIVYEKDQKIYSEIWQYTGSSWVNYQTPTVISNPSHQCSNPNIDRYNARRLAIVWETQNNGIYGATGNITGSIYSNTQILSEGTEPDVAVSSNPGGSYNSSYFITMTCKLDDYSLRMYRYQFQFFNVSNIIGYESFDTDNEILGTPRIAANLNSNVPYQTWPYEVVVVAEDNGSYYVYGLHYYDQNLTITTLNAHTYDNNGIVDPTNYKAKEPVVSFLEDIKVAWAYKPPNLSNSYEIIKRTLSVYDGTLKKYNNNYTYSIVNSPDYDGDQEHPSICTRLAYLKDQFIGWYDTYSNKPDFKHRETNVEIYGAEAEITSGLVHPNPAGENLFITLDDKATKANVDIYSIDGCHVLSRTIQPQNNKVDISNLNSGIYLLKIKTGRKQKTAKVIVR